MPVTHPIYRDIFIDKGTTFSQTIELSIPFAEYDFEGYVKSSYTSATSIPLAFAAVDNEPNKAVISITAENTRLLRRIRGIYDIFATNKDSGEIHKEREGTAHYNESVTNDPAPLPPLPTSFIQLKPETDYLLDPPTSLPSLGSCLVYHIKPTATVELDLANIILSSESLMTFPKELIAESVYVIKLNYGENGWMLVSLDGGYS